MSLGQKGDNGGPPKHKSSVPSTTHQSSSSIASTQKGPLEPDNVVRWNTANLGLRIAADASSAVAAATLIAPIITLIDRQKVATNKPLFATFWPALRSAVTRPHSFLASKPFLLIFTLYSGTYLTANTLDTVTSTVKRKPASTVTAGPAKFVATSTFNMSMSVYKDSCFAKIFRNPAASPAAKIPRLSYALFAFRDSLTIFASFNLPPVLAPRLSELPAPVKQRLGRIVSTESGRTNTAQFLTPALMQIFSTPIHLIALDLYNRQGRVGYAGRLARMTRDWGVAALARMGRIIPAFGVGGVVNTNVRKNLMARIEGGT